MKRFLIAFSRRTVSNTELKFSVKELSDEVSSHALLCPQRTFILYEALGESIDDIYAQLNTISFFNIIRLDFSNLPQAIGKIYMFGKFMPSPDGNGNIIYNSNCQIAIPVENLSSNFVIVNIWTINPPAKKYGKWVIFIIYYIDIFNTFHSLLLICMFSISPFNSLDIIFCI